MTCERLKRLFSLVAALATLSGCNAAARLLNPFYEEPPPEAYYGEKNDRAISGGRQKGVDAREALETMASYRRGQEPQPNYPVIYPAVVRVMWIPDHLNRYNDLIPQHYYYLRVLDDRPAVTDAFELIDQLDVGKNKSSTIPYIHVSDQP